MRQIRAWGPAYRQAKKAELDGGEIATDTEALRVLSG